MPKNHSIDPESEAAKEIIQRKIDEERIERLEQEKRERLIAKTHQMLGQIEGLNLIKDFGNVTSLVLLKELKETKIYRDIPGVGSWENLCNRLGKSRRTVDLDIQNLNVFGEQFLATVANFKVGYRELSKLRYAVKEGDITVKNDALMIGDETIPIDDNHKEEVKAAIDTILERAETAEGENKRLKKNQDRIIEEETKALETEKEALVKENQRLKAYDPEGESNEYFIEKATEIQELAGKLDSTIRRFIVPGKIREDDEIVVQIAGRLVVTKRLICSLQLFFEVVVKLPVKLCKCDLEFPPIRACKKRGFKALPNCSPRPFYFSMRFFSAR